MALALAIQVPSIRLPKIVEFARLEKPGTKLLKPVRLARIVSALSVISPVATNVSNALLATPSTTLQICVRAMVVTSDQTTPSALLANLASTSMVDHVWAVKSNTALTAPYQLLESAMPVCHHSHSVLTTNADAQTIRFSTRLPIFAYLLRVVLPVSTTPEATSALSAPKLPHVLRALHLQVLALFAQLVCISIMILNNANQYLGVTECRDL